MEYKIIFMLTFLHMSAGYFFGVHKSFQLLKNFRTASLKFVSNYMATDVLMLELKKLSFKIAWVLMFYTITIAFIAVIMTYYYQQYYLWKYHLFLLAAFKITSDLFYRIRSNLKWYEADRHSRIAYVFSSYYFKIPAITAGIILFLII